MDTHLERDSPFEIVSPNDTMKTSIFKHLELSSNSGRHLPCVAPTDRTLARTNLSLVVEFPNLEGVFRYKAAYIYKLIDVFNNLSIDGEEECDGSLNKEEEKNACKKK